MVSQRNLWLGIQCDNSLDSDKTIRNDLGSPEHITHMQYYFCKPLSFGLSQFGKR